MKWIFDECIDTYGSCIRQYTALGISAFISFYAFWSFIKTYKKQRKFNVELVPLFINLLTTLFMTFLFIFAEDLYNTHLVIMLIQMYSYFLIAFMFTIMYLKSDIKTESSTIHLINIVFISLTVLIVLAVIGITFLSYFKILKCSEKYWIGILIVFGLELPIYIVIQIYCSKTKKKVRQLAKNSSSKQYKAQSQLHIFQGQDSFVRLKILQTNLIIFTFTFTLIMHFVQIILYFFMNQDRSLCLNDTNRIMVTNQAQLIIIGLGNLSQVFPHLMIPIIFWYLQNKFINSCDTFYITPKTINSRINTGIDLDFEDDQIHKKLKY